MREIPKIDIKKLLELSKTEQYFKMLFTQVATNKDAYCYYLNTCIMNGITIQTAKKILQDLAKGTYGTNRQNQ